MPASTYCTHSLRERQSIGWDISPEGYAVCRSCGLPHAQSVTAVQTGSPVQDYDATQREHARITQPILVVTANEVAGHQITEVHGDVFGLTVRVRNALSNAGASIRSIVGGEVTGYTKLLVESRREARQRMIDEARAVGANAVIAMRFDCNELGDIMSEVVAYGTAVTIRKTPAPGATHPDDT